MKRLRLLLLSIAALWLPVSSAAQSANSEPSRLWIVGGVASTTVRGDCQTCEEDYPYRHGPGILGNIGYRLNERADIGGEIFWVPIDVEHGQLNATHFDAVAQFRPWRTKGFFVKGGAGMAFIRNWVDTLGPDSINSKALSVVIGGGWVFRADRRIGVQLFGSQHAGALGDLQTASADVQDVLGNYWSFGAALVFR